jgi:hypothetical protein
MKFLPSLLATPRCCASATRELQAGGGIEDGWDEIVENVNARLERVSFDLRFSVSSSKSFCVREIADKPHFNCLRS